MKKFFMFLLIILSFGMTCWAEVGFFTGFEAEELSLEEVELISGGETYVGYTYVALGRYHTLTVVTDKPITDPTFEVLHVFESGAGKGGSSSSSGSSSSLGIGYNVQQHYYKPSEIKANPSKFELQLVTPAAGMSIKEFDHKVVAVAESYFAEKPKLYLVLHRNCNTTTSTILARAGGYIVPSKSMWRLPGWKKW